MSYTIVEEFPDEIIHEKNGPFISLYQPTHRYSPDNIQDPIRFKNLITSIENSLQEKFPKSNIDALMKPLIALEEDQVGFWNNTKDGLAILANENKCIVYKLQLPVKERAVVGDKLYIKPLIRYFQSADRYLLLALDKKQFSIYEGNRYGVEKIEFDSDIPVTIEEVLGKDYTEAYLSVGTYGGVGKTPMFHGHGGKKEEVNKDTKKYFRYVDKFVIENYSNKMKLPVILAGLDEHHGLFKTISNNHYLLDKGIKKDYKSLSKEEMTKEAWNVTEPFYRKKIDDLIDKYNVNKSKGLGSDNLNEVSQAIFANRVDTLILEADRTILGSLDNESGKFKAKKSEESSLDNIVSDLAILTYRSKGKIVVLPQDRIPSKTGLAAIFRY